MMRAPEHRRPIFMRFLIGRDIQRDRRAADCMPGSDPADESLCTRSTPPKPGAVWRHSRKFIAEEFRWQRKMGSEPPPPRETTRLSGWTGSAAETKRCTLSVVYPAGGPRVRIPFPPAERWYGAGGEEMAPSSLQPTDGVP